jgi:hypothetical protein
MSGRRRVTASVTASNGRRPAEKQAGPFLRLCSVVVAYGANIRQIRMILFSQNIMDNLFLWWSLAFDLSICWDCFTGWLNGTKSRISNLFTEENRLLEYYSDEWRVQLAVDQRMRLVMEISTSADSNVVSTKRVCSASILIERCVSQLDRACETSEYRQGRHIFR